MKELPRTWEAGVTVVTPVHNGQRHLPGLWTALRREFASLPGSRWIIVEDGSTDGTPNLLANLERANPSVATVLHSGGVGAGEARNVGLRAVRTRWVTFVDADDDVEPGSLRAWFEAAERLTPDVLITGSPASLSERRTRRWAGAARVLDEDERWSSEVFRDWIPGGKFYRTGHVYEHGIAYSSAPEGQDLGFFVWAVAAATRVAAAPESPRYLYGPPTNTDADRAPRAPRATLDEFATAVRRVRRAAPSPSQAVATTSPLHAGASAFLLRSLAFAETSQDRRALVQDFTRSDAYLRSRRMISLDRRDIALCLAAQVVVLGGDVFAAQLGGLFRSSQRRRNDRRNASRAPASASRELSALRLEGDEPSTMPDSGRSLYG